MCQSSFLTAAVRSRPPTSPSVSPLFFSRPFTVETWYSKDFNYPILQQPFLLVAVLRHGLNTWTNHTSYIPTLFAKLLFRCYRLNSGSFLCQSWKMRGHQNLTLLCVLLLAAGALSWGDGSSARRARDVTQTQYLTKQDSSIVTLAPSPTPEVDRTSIPLFSSSSPLSARFSPAQSTQLPMLEIT